MKRVVMFTDTHFGVKNNSVTWFRSQEKFIRDELIPYISKVKPAEVICLGDVFDVRSTVSVMIGEQVREMFSKIASLTPRFTIIGGNHDYFSPNSDRYNSVSMILRGIPNLHIYSSGITIYDHCMYLPWYEWLKFLNKEISPQQLEDFQASIKEGYIKNVFTHADIWREDIPLFHSVDVFSGHIHTPRCEPEKHLYNLGSCFPLTFADSNQERCFFDVEFDDQGSITKFTPVVNKSSIRFWRFYNEDIFEKFDKTNPELDDYIELYVTKQKLIEGNFIRRIDDLNHKYKNLWCIPILEAGQLDESISTDKLISLDMKSMILNYIPPELMPKFQQVLNKYEESQSY